MKTIYLDADFMCHLENAEGRTEVQTDAFDGVVDRAIQYYRYIPQGEEWTDPRKGKVYHGIFIQATDSAKIDRCQVQAQLEDMKNALAILGVSP